MRHPGTLWAHPRATPMCQDLTLHGVGGRGWGLTMKSWKPDLNSSLLLLPTPPKSIFSHLSEDDTSSNGPRCQVVASRVTPLHVASSSPPSCTPSHFRLKNSTEASGQAQLSLIQPKTDGRGRGEPSFHEQIFIEPYSRPGPMLSVRNTEVNKTDAVLPLWGLCGGKEKLIMQLMIWKQTLNLTRDVGRPLS